MADPFLRGPAWKPGPYEVVGVSRPFPGFSLQRRNEIELRRLRLRLDTREVYRTGRAVSLSPLETADEARAHAREHGHAFDIIKDPEGRIADLLDARRTPEAFLLDSSGTLRYHGRIASKISAPDLKTAIDALLAGRPIHPAETKAFGCAIPRR